MLSQNILECDWNIVLPFYNSVSERSRVAKINPNLKLAKYPLTRDYLNYYYTKSDHKLKQSITQYDCASAMYSFFVMTFGINTSNGDDGKKPGATGAEPYSTGFNPFGVINWDILPSWAWWLILIAGILVVKKTLD